MVNRNTEASETAIRRFGELVRSGEVEEYSGELRLGIDLGTANIVVSVVDAQNRPVAGDWLHSSVVRDGIVVDWLGATSAVRELTKRLESRLGYEFVSASASIPPGVGAANATIFRNVVEAADLDLVELVDEPVAAARVLGMSDGAVIDIGHGTTGVSVLENGELILSVDEATGGHHMTLVLAGNRRIDYDEAEALKKDPKTQRLVQGVIRPTLERMATIAAHALDRRDLPVVYLVGGSSSFENAPTVFTSILGRPVIRPTEPLFITPLGVAMKEPYHD
ncbi:MAG: ethanolamine utilization protein EutJ [Propionibacterium sp.]|nr:ethanolamine utilization protein EutJ [Propionibacterium sp.]